MVPHQAFPRLEEFGKDRTAVRGDMGDGLRPRGPPRISPRSAALWASELGWARRVGIFRDPLRPLARDLPLGIRLMRTVAGTDPNRPVEMAEGRRVCELHPRRSRSWPQSRPGPCAAVRPSPERSPGAAPRLPRVPTSPFVGADARSSVPSGYGVAAGRSWRIRWPGAEPVRVSGALSRERSRLRRPPGLHGRWLTWYP